MGRVRIPSPIAWLAPEMQASKRWLYELSAADREELWDALTVVRERGLSIPFTRQDFPLKTFGETLRRLWDEVENGSGVLLLRGLDVDRYGLDGTRLVYWGIGAHVGTALAQNPQGALLVDVRNEGGDPYRDVKARGYHTSQYLPFHNDQGDVVGLLCFRAAKEGGESCIASSAAVYNEILRTRPDLLEELFKPYCVDIRDEQPAGRAPYYVEPRFAFHNGRFYAQHGPTYVKSAQRFDEVPRLTDAQLEAMDLVDELVRTDEFRLDMGFRPGDIQFLNNHTVLHSRTSFEDYEEPERRRHLLRLWLRTPAYRDVPPFFRQRFEDMDIWLKNPVPPVGNGLSV